MILESTSLRVSHRVTFRKRHTKRKVLFDLNAEIVGLIAAMFAAIVLHRIFREATLCGEYLPQ